MFRTPGSAAFCVAAFVMRLPIAFYPIGLVLLVSSRTGHYSFAGLLSGAYVIANGIGNPVLARLVDRHGQRRMLLPCVGVHLAALVAIIVQAQVHAPERMLLIPTAVAGFFYLSVGALVRARWSFVLGGRPELSTAYSLESTLDEVIFTVGPLVATLIATQLDPVLVFVLGGGFVGFGAAWLRRQTATEPPAQAVGAARHRSALRYRGLGLLVLVAVCMGGVFASAEVTIVAFCGQHHATSLSGALLACFAFGSGVAGFVYGGRQRSGHILRRFLRQALVFGALPLLFLLAVNLPVLAVLAFVVGTGIAPTLITAFGLIERIVPDAALTEGMSWLTTGLSVGFGIAAAFVGKLADAHGARFAFSVTITSGLLVALLATLLFRRLRHQVIESLPLTVGSR